MGDFDYVGTSSLEIFLGKETMARLRTVLLLALWGVGDALSFRAGTSGDRGVLMKRVFREKMNPLGIAPGNFIIAEAENEVIGFGQVREAGGVWELASLVVEKDWRGKGVGVQLVQKLLKRHHTDHPGEALFLITLEGTRGFYQKAGFVVEEDPPTGMMKMEMMVGSVVAGLATGQGLICMIAHPLSEEEQAALQLAATKEKVQAFVDDKTEQFSAWWDQMTAPHQEAMQRCLEGVGTEVKTTFDWKSAIGTMIADYKHKVASNILPAFMLRDRPPPPPPRKALFEKDGKCADLLKGSAIPPPEWAHLAASAVAQSRALGANVELPEWFPSPAASWQEVWPPLSPVAGSGVTGDDRAAGSTASVTAGFTLGAGIGVATGVVCYAGYGCNRWSQRLGRMSMKSASMMPGQLRFAMKI